MAIINVVQVRQYGFVYVLLYIADTEGDTLIYQPMIVNYADIQVCNRRIKQGIYLVDINIYDQTIQVSN